MKNNLMQIRKTNDLIKLVTREHGYTEKSGNGSSHRIFTATGKATLSIPNNREVAPGTLRNVVKLLLGEEYYNKGQTS